LIDGFVCHEFSLDGEPFFYTQPYTGMMQVYGVWVSKSKKAAARKKANVVFHPLNGYPMGLLERLETEGITRCSD
jgi:hypothetical protein